MDKKTWIKPELISLTRCRPEEAVLDVCKYGQISPDPSTNCTGCVQGTVGDCTRCEQYSSS
jgi:hypothetical protein